MDSIGSRIKAERNRAGLTQKEVAARAGMADSAIRKYEAGKQIPKIETLSRIADAIGVDFSNIAFPGGSEIEADCQEVIGLYRQLNSAGKAKAIKRIKDLTQLPQYTD